MFLCFLSFHSAYILFVCYVFLSRNNSMFISYNQLQISCINTVLSINYHLLFLFLSVTKFNLETLNVLSRFFISIFLITNVESYVFFYVFYLAFLVFHACKCNNIKKRILLTHVYLLFETIIQKYFDNIFKIVRWEWICKLYSGFAFELKINECSSKISTLPPSYRLVCWRYLLWYFCCQ